MTDDQELDRLADAVAERVHKKLSLAGERSVPEKAPVAPAAPESKTEKHIAYEFMKHCPECGTDNPDYKQPDLKCKSCGVPLGRYEDQEKIKKCWNCGGVEAERIHR